DFHEILKTVNERKAEFGIDIVYCPHPNWANPLAEFMGLNEGIAWLDGDQAKPSADNPVNKDFFLFMNELYREGLLYKEYLAQRPEDFFQQVRSGKVFAASYNTGLAADVNKVFDESGISGQLVPVTKALPWKGETKFQPMDGNIGWASCFISKDVSDPKRAIRYMEFLKSPEGDALTQWGIEDTHYTLDENNLLVRPEGFSALTGTETGIGPWYFMASGLGEGVAVSSGVNNPDQKAAEYSKYGIDLLQFRKAAYARNPVLYFATNFSVDLPEYEIRVKINTEYTQWRAKIITAETAEQAEQLYDDMMEAFRAAGLADWEKVMTDSYNTAAERYK
ncbi:MAG: hypothetical protein LBU58_07335, partial [Clostridiales bacterium]|nr:hypothetical protein [Clostridiales bacterium]